jgi:hypothetical protein
MNWAPAEAIAKAVLYEGCLLYPYRPSALKNRERWTFGRVEPGGVAGTEFLVEGGPDCRLELRVRFLEEDGSTLREREIATTVGRRHEFPGGVVECARGATKEGRDLYALRVGCAPGGGPLLSCHALLGIEGGRFLSMTDPLSADCRHEGLWPILVGPELLLAAPIILEDHPSIAPESPGDLFDGTEIDEILTLRIRTLADSEKEEIRLAGGLGERLLERAESLSPEKLRELHGARRLPRAGDRVRLRPQGRADIMDLALEGRQATVVAVEEDLEGRRYVAVTVADDPGGDLGMAGFPGHRFFFRPEEVELL